MLALLALSAPGWIPVFVVEQRVDAVDVWAASPAAATNAAARWTVNGAGPSEEFPFQGEVDGRTVGASPYPRTTRPYVRLTDRRTVGGCWYVTATTPRHSAAFRVPTLAEWRRKVAAYPGAAVDPSKHVGIEIDLDVRSVNLDAPDYRPNWSPYRRYLVVESLHVWYYPAATPAEAVKRARAEWIDGGVYALGRRLRYAEASSLGAPAAKGDLAGLVALRKRLPARAWAALRASRCEPLRVRDRLPGSFETVTRALPPQRPPFDNRTVGSGGVPYFSDGI